jgi:hypothetical protein
VNDSSTSDADKQPAAEKPAVRSSAVIEVQALGCQEANSEKEPASQQEVKRQDSRAVKKPKAGPKATDGDKVNEQRAKLVSAGPAAPIMGAVYHESVGQFSTCAPLCWCCPPLRVSA